jgi:putative oxidoreductase
VHIGHGFFAANNGVELPLLFATGALVLAFTGPGDYSLDRLLGLLWLSTPRHAWIAVAVAVAGALANFLVTRLAPASRTRAA